MWYYDCFGMTDLLQYLTAPPPLPPTTQKEKTEKSSFLVYSTKHVNGHGCFWLKRRELNCFFIKNLEGNSYIFV